MEDLQKAHPKGSQIIYDYKKAIGECKGGRFDTPFLQAVKKRILVKEWGENG